MLITYHDTVWLSYTIVFKNKNSQYHSIIIVFVKEIKQKKNSIIGINVVFKQQQ